MIGLDNRTGPRPSLDDVDLARMVRALDAGTPAAAVAKAFGVNVRTVHRYRAARILTVDVDGWPIVFLIYPGRRPVLVSARTHARVRP